MWRIKTMNLKKSASLGILFIGITGLLGFESVEARSNPNQSTYSTEHSRSSSDTIAQVGNANNPIYGTWKLTYSVDAIVYESTLVMSGYSGEMRTRYYNPNTQRAEVIRQNMALKSIPKGLFLIGSNPVHDRTSRKAIDYSPDNFLFSITPDGPVFLTCDRMERCSYVELEVIK
jgi:hypothetical protein